MRSLAAAIIVSTACAATGAWATGEFDAVLGKALFERAWISAPASTDAADGLGPLFNARSCASCHAGPALAARFTATSDGQFAWRGMVVRFADAVGGTDPIYGLQLQTHAVSGLAAEGRVIIAASPGSDRYDVSFDLERGPLDAATRQSVRVAPALIGRSALDRIDENAVFALADPGDLDQDGISGRARIVEIEGRRLLGRYGWKGAIPSLDDQVADAFARDLGLSSPKRPLPHGDCTALQPDCLAAPTGESGRFGGYELSVEIVALVAAYVASLEGPAPPVGEAPGATIFAELGCVRCHVPSLPATDGRMVPAYTDLLLHDMGVGLDDGMGEPGVASSEWRTAPLIALRSGAGRRYLHDGRAATVEAAIQAHGGEAASAAAGYLALPEDERRTLTFFAESL